MLHLPVFISHGHDLFRITFPFDEFDVQRMEYSEKRMAELWARMTPPFF